MVGLTVAISAVAFVVAIESGLWISILLLAVFLFWIGLHLYFFKTPNLIVDDTGVTIVGHHRSTHLDWSEVRSLQRSGSVLVIMDQSQRLHRCPSVANTISEQSKGSGYVETTIEEIRTLRASWGR